MITFVRKYLVNAYTALPLLVCFMLTSFSSFARHNANTRLTFMSGEDMFRGVFFLEGQFAQMLPEAQSLKTAYYNQTQSVAQQATVAQVRQTVLSSIESAHPGYFAHFKSVLKGGDNQRVSQALAEGEALVGEALNELYHLDKGQLAKLQAQAQAEAARHGGKLDVKALEKLVGQMQKGQARDANNGTCAVAAVLLVAVVAVVAWVWAWVGIEAEEITLNGHTKGHSLLQEQIVASICTVAPHIA